MASEKTNLNPCPFCGEKSRLKLTCKSSFDGGFTVLNGRVERHTWTARCNVCYARGPAIGGKVVERRLVLDGRETLPSWATTDEELKEKATALWNRRAEDAEVR